MFDELRSVFVVPDDRDEPRLCPENGQVVGDVRRAADPYLLAFEVDDRHRRFRRDPLRIAPKVSIEHDIADDRDLQRSDNIE